MTTRARTESDTIASIARRAHEIAADAYGRRNAPTVLDFVLCIEKAHGRTPLRLYELSIANEDDFAHDVFGIHRHLNRETGELKNSFTPRYAA